MAGHSKWANIRHRKGAQDAKRGKVFTKIQKEIAVAVKTGGGGDPEHNPRLRAAIQSARQVNMPKDNIERAIKKAQGANANSLIETTFEGHGPGGVAVFVECTTDNNTRTVAQIRHHFQKHGGTLGKDGCLQFIFERKAVFAVLKEENKDEEEMTLELIDMGIEDIELQEGVFTLIAPMKEFGNIQKKLEEKGLTYTEAKLRQIPSSYANPDKNKFTSLMKLIEALENDDDVQEVYHNIALNEEGGLDI